MAYHTKTPKSELGKNYSTQILEDMMYTDQLWEGEIPDNFDDSIDDDYDINRSNRSSLSIQKNSFYQRSFEVGKKYSKVGDLDLMSHRSWEKPVSKRIIEPNRFIK